MKPNRFYVYAYLREDDTPYYIGKGSFYRSNSKHYNNYGSSVPRDKQRIQIIQENMLEHEAFELERSLIAQYGRKDIGTGILRNLTDGGEGTSGRVATPEQREKIRRSKLGVPLSEAHKAKMREAAKNRPKESEDTRQKRRARVTGKGNPCYDPTIYHFKHDVYGEFIGTRNQLKNTFPELNIYTGNLSLIIKHPHKRCKGWYCPNASTHDDHQQ